MTTETPVIGDAETRAAAGSTKARPRDAAGTRQRLLHAARRRFAADGYSGTTVRDIAADADVNVALINRYFTSKEGLFEACLRGVVEDLDRPALQDPTVDQVVDAIIEQLVDRSSSEHPLQLLLLLRSSGNERADEIRRQTLTSFAEGMATAAGSETTSGDALLRAQIALSTVLGIVLLRSSARLEPLTSATGSELRGPLHSAISHLLNP